MVTDTKVSAGGIAIPFPYEEDREGRGCGNRTEEKA